MSLHNVKGAIFAILNENGVFDIYSNTGEKIEMFNTQIRITQSSVDLDKIVIIGIVNVVRNQEEMKEIINSYE